MGLHGTASAPILIEAASDGGATVDGSKGNNNLLFVQRSSYITFCGLNFQRAAQGVVESMAITMTQST